MEFRILGPIEVCSDGGALALGGRRPRALISVLALHANEVVAADWLIEEVWGDDVPESAAASLRTYVSRLRKALPRDMLITRAPGYLLRIGPGELDLHRFERLVDEGRRLLAGGQAADGSVRLREALAVWRGQALADFAYEDFAQTAVVRLEEIRLRALELRIGADLALGRHHELVGELKALVAEYPLRERFRGCLMTALYRSDRQAEALDVYQDAHRTLVDELGIEPSPALQDLERQILRHDRRLDLPATIPGPVRGDSERAILVAVADEGHVDALLAVAEPLVRRPPRAIIVARLVPDVAELPSASAWLDKHRLSLVARGVAARVASFTSSAPGDDLARLAIELDVDLLLTDAPESLLTDGFPDEQLTALLSDAPCDVALLVPRGATPSGPVVVPFGGADTDWSAVELGAWLAHALDVSLRLAGDAEPPEQGRCDASRLLSRASLAVQRVLGVAAEPVLSSPGDDGQPEASRDAGLLVVGLSSRWHHDGPGLVRLGLARRATPPMLLVHRGLRPGGLAPPAALTRFTWSLRSYL